MNNPVLLKALRSLTYDLCRDATDEDLSQHWSHYNGAVSVLETLIADGVEVPQRIIDEYAQSVLEVAGVDEVCQAIYSAGSQGSVYDFVNEYCTDLDDTVVAWGRCEPCESESPYVVDENACLVCGSPVTPTGTEGDK